MSEPTEPTELPAAQSAPLTYAPPQQEGQKPIVLRIATAIGAAGCLVGVALAAIAMFGAYRALSLWVVPMILGAAGFLATIASNMVERKRIDSDTLILGSFFCAALAIFGGLFEMLLSHP